jgi:hypothetical protein
VLTDAVAAVLDRFDFDAYGIAVGFDAASAPTSLLFAGEQFDARIHQ